eukprot:3225801-Pyramimonas_sp.AAC.1
MVQSDAGGAGIFSRQTNQMPSSRLRAAFGGPRLCHTVSDAYVLQQPPASDWSVVRLYPSRRFRSMRVANQHSHTKVYSPV